jgi:hypothetical protein
MKSLRPLYTSIYSRLRRFISAFVADISLVLRYNSYTIRFALYMLPESEYSSDNLREVLQSLG